MLLCLRRALLLLKKKEREKKTTANGSILSINLAITHKYVLDEVFQFDITDSTLQNVAQSDYTCSIPILHAFSKYRRQDAQHIFFVYLKEISLN